MNLVSGTVHTIDDGLVKTGHFAGSPYKTVVLTTGNKLTAFDLTFITGIELGKEYTFPVEQKGTYVNIVGAITPCIQQGTSTTPQGLPSESIPLPQPNIKPAEEVLPKVHSPSDERQFKNRISALGSAVDFVKGGTAKTDQVLEIAESFFKWINGEV